jgi:hypothetical protein
LLEEFKKKLRKARQKELYDNSKNEEEFEDFIVGDEEDSNEDKEGWTDSDSNDEIPMHKKEREKKKPNTSSSRTPRRKSDSTKRNEKKRDKSRGRGRSRERKKNKDDGTPKWTNSKTKQKKKRKNDVLSYDDVPQTNDDLGLDFESLMAQRYEDDYDVSDRPCSSSQSRNFATKSSRQAVEAPPKSNIHKATKSARKTVVHGAWALNDDDVRVKSEVVEDNPAEKKQDHKEYEHLEDSESSENFSQFSNEPMDFEPVEDEKEGEQLEESDTDFVMDPNNVLYKVLDDYDDDNGFRRGWEVEKIVNIVEEEDELHAIVKFKGYKYSQLLRLVDVKEHAFEKLGKYLIEDGEKKAAEKITQERQQEKEKLRLSRFKK